mmetsp:Transcript_44129/g.87572  ORF Transcript_44129/g.87572 Transcript_44129/m.87572 type:complete len:81 (-) Transcript_44129:126-368(-)
MVQVLEVMGVSTHARGFQVTVSYGCGHGHCFTQRRSRSLVLKRLLMVCIEDGPLGTLVPAAGVVLSYMVPFLVPCQSALA